MIAAFAKRLCRLALSAPPAGCLFISALTFNLIRRHPTLLPLIHRAPGGAAVDTVSAASKRKSVDSNAGASNKKAKTASSSDGDEGSESEVDSNDESDQSEDEEALADADDFEVERARATAAAAAVLGAAPDSGIDVFDAAQDDPALARALESSLWELKSLQSHYVWAVATQTKLFEAENAPKQDFDLQPLCEQSYHSMMEEEIARKAEAKPALAVHTPKCLFGQAGAAASASSPLGTAFSAWSV